MTPIVVLIVLLLLGWAWFMHITSPRRRENRRQRG